MVNFYIAFPSDIFSDIPHLREKTVRIANLIRTANLFRLKKIIVFKHHKSDDQLISLMDFFLTPSYLRKFRFKIDKNFKYTGCAPPIRAEYEKWKDKRIGLVLNYDHTKKILEVIIDRNERVNLKYEKNIQGKMILLKKHNNAWEIDTAEQDLLEKVSFVENFIEFLKELKKKGFLVISTAREGQMLNLDLCIELKRIFSSHNEIIFLFGSPKEGLHEIFREFDANINDYSDFILNIFPNQGIETIRTDEAIFGTLSIFNLFRI